MEEVIKKLQDEQRVTIKDRPFSCPVGAATYQKDIDVNLRDTFARADENMYKEKMSRKERANANESLNF
jgi:GGDEF domain-containing protein